MLMQWQIWGQAQQVHPSFGRGVRKFCNVDYTVHCEYQIRAVLNA